MPSQKSIKLSHFDFEIGFLVKEDKIIGGFAAVIAKAFIFKFYVVPYGPIVSLGYEEYLDKLSNKFNI